MVHEQVRSNGTQGQVIERRVGGAGRKMGVSGGRIQRRGDCVIYFFFQAEDGIRDLTVTGVQTCALPIYAQQAAIASNAPYFQSADMPARQWSSKYDDKAGEQQWDRLQKAQEVAAATVRPLRVNLPTRGLRHSFSQVLQTEVGKPMLVSFVAASAKAASWPMRIGLFALSFVGLWAVVSWVLTHRKVGAAA